MRARLTRPAPSLVLRVSFSRAYSSSPVSVITNGDFGPGMTILPLSYP